MTFEVPASIAQHVARWPGGEPAAPRDAATVLLLRDGAAGLEVFLLHRLRALAAFGGMTAFPGGSVDPADLGADAVPAAWQRELSASAELAAALACAAVRELFEEAGVLLATPAGGAHAIPDRAADQAAHQAADSAADRAAGVHTAQDEADRAALEAREISFSDLLARRGLVLRTDLLRPWAHWITPIQEPRRFDTRFFVAALPPGQRTVEHTGEAERVWWARPADALAARERGELSMVPPTAITLAELAEFGTVAEVLAAPRSVRPLLPRLVAEGDVLRFELPE